MHECNVIIESLSHVHYHHHHHKQHQYHLHSFCARAKLHRSRPVTVCDSSAYNVGMNVLGLPQTMTLAVAFGCVLLTIQHHRRTLLPCLLAIGVFSFRWHFYYICMHACKHICLLFITNSPSTLISSNVIFIKHTNRTATLKHVARIRYTMIQE